MHEEDERLVKVLERDQIKYSDRPVEYRMSWAVERIIQSLFRMGMEKSVANLEFLHAEYVQNTEKWYD